MAMRRWPRMSRMRSVSVKSVSRSTSSARRAAQGTSSSRAEDPMTNIGRIRSRSSASSCTSTANPRLPRWAWIRSIQLGCRMAGRVQLAEHAGQYRGVGQLVEGEAVHGEVAVGVGDAAAGRR